MDTRDFANWLRGFLDAVGGSLSPEQVKIVGEKLATVRATPDALTFTPYPLLPPVTYPQPYVQPDYPNWPRGTPQIICGNPPTGITCT